MRVRLNRNRARALCHLETGDHLQGVKIEYPRLVLIFGGEHRSVKCRVNGNAFNFKTQIDGLDDGPVCETKQRKFFVVGSEVRNALAGMDRNSNVFIGGSYRCNFCARDIVDYPYALPAADDGYRNAAHRINCHVFDGTIKIDLLRIESCRAGGQIEE